MNSHKPENAKSPVAKAPGVYDSIEEEVVSRLRRIETRWMNGCRSMGMLPGMHPPDPLKPRAVWDHKTEQIYVTASSVSLGDVLACGVLNCKGETRDVKVILANQEVATVRILGDREPAAGRDD